MAAADQSKQNLLDQFLMTDDDPGDFRFYLRVSAPALSMRCSISACVSMMQLLDQRPVASSQIESELVQLTNHYPLITYLLLSSNDKKYFRTVSLSAAGNFSQFESCSAWRR